MKETYDKKRLLQCKEALEKINCKCPSQKSANELFPANVDELLFELDKLFLFQESQFSLADIEYVIADTIISDQNTENMFSPAARDLATYYASHKLLRENQKMIINLANPKFINLCVEHLLFMSFVKNS